MSSIRERSKKVSKILFAILNEHPEKGGGMETLRAFNAFFKKLSKVKITRKKFAEQLRAEGLYRMASLYQKPKKLSKEAKKKTTGDRLHSIFKEHRKAPEPIAEGT